MYCGPLEGIFPPLQPLAYGDPQFLAIGVFKSPNNVISFEVPRKSRAASDSQSLAWILNR